KEVRVIAPKFRARDYIYTVFHPKTPLFCVICTTKRGFFGTNRDFEAFQASCKFTFVKNIRPGQIQACNLFFTLFILCCSTNLRNHFKFDRWEKSLLEGFLSAAILR